MIERDVLKEFHDNGTGAASYSEEDHHCTLHDDGTYSLCE